MTTTFDTQNAADYVKTFGAPKSGTTAYDYVNKSNPSLVVSPASTAPVTPDRTPGLLQKSQEDAAAAAASQAAARSEADNYAAQQRQSRIDAINTTFSPRIQREQQQGDSRLSRVAALNFRSGIVGSGVDTTKIGEQKDLNESALRAIEDSKASAISEAFSWADQLGKERADQIYKEKTEGANANVALYKEKADTAMKALDTFGSQNITADQLKSVDPKTYETLRDVSGMSDSQIDAYLKTKAPAGTYNWDQAQVHGTTMVVPKIVNGKVTLEKLDLGFKPTAEFKGSAKTDKGVIAFFGDGSYKYIGDPNSKSSDWGGLSNSDKSDAENWLRQQSDFTQSDIEKLHNDRTFQALVLKKVAEEKAAVADPFKSK